MQVESYLMFNGRCEEAIEFYKKALGAEVEAMMRFKDNPEPPSDPNMIPPGSDDKIMHACFRIGDTHVMASDGCDPGDTNFQGFPLALTVADEAEAKRFYNALSEGGEVQMPLARSFFSPAFGMVRDRFGVSWMVVAEVAAEQTAAA
jgi:PhnB protein